MAVSASTSGRPSGASSAWRRSSSEAASDARCCLTLKASEICTTSVRRQRAPISVSSEGKKEAAPQRAPMSPRRLRQLLDRALVHGLVTKYTTKDLLPAAVRQLAKARLMHMAVEGRSGATHYCQLYGLIPSPDHRAAPAPTPEPAIAEPAPPAAAAGAAEVDAKVE